MAVGARLDKANALIGAGRLDEAAEILEKIVMKRPREARALHMLGVAYAMRGKFVEAESLLGRAQDASPRSAIILTDFAALFVKANRHAEALPLLEKALRLEPDLKQARFYYGVVLTSLDRPHEALEVFDRLAEREPTSALYQHNRASLLVQFGRHDEADPIVDRILTSELYYPPASLLKGLIEMNRGKFAEALSIYDRILARTPDYAEAVYNRGFLRLLTGQWVSGWVDYESRWKRENSPKVGPNLSAPHWRGEPLGGRTLLVYAEQGLGDIFMCCRYMPLLRKQGAEVYFLGPAQLVPLLRTMSEDIHYVDSVPADQEFDFQVALMSLPGQFGTDLTNIPRDVPYLHAAPEKVKHWKKEIGAGSGALKIGINWQGNPKAKVDAGRSIPLREFYSISQLPGVRLISLQKHAGLEQLQDLPSGMTVETLESSGTDGFIDTSAVMQNMDLIVSSDTSIANLAGALGLPAFIALKRIPDWRWMLDRSDCPWFPTLRLFRQKTDGKWSDVFEAIAAEIARRVQ
jgi:predicted Zn-dependent protease